MSLLEEYVQLYKQISSIIHLLIVVKKSNLIIHLDQLNYLKDRNYYYHKLKYLVQVFLSFFNQVLKNKNLFLLNLIKINL